MPGPNKNPAGEQFFSKLTFEDEQRLRAVTQSFTETPKASSNQQDRWATTKNLLGEFRRLMDLFTYLVMMELFEKAL